MNSTSSGLERFWNLVVDVWGKGVGGVDIGTIVTAIAIFFAFFVLRRLFTNLVIRRLKALAAKTSRRVDDDILEALDRPIRFVPIVFGAFVVDEYIAPTGTIADVADNIVRALVAFNIFWIFHRAVEPLGAKEAQA